MYKITQYWYALVILVILEQKRPTPHSSADLCMNMYSVYFSEWFYIINTSRSEQLTVCAKTHLQFHLRTNTSFQSIIPFFHLWTCDCLCMRNTGLSFWKCVTSNCLAKGNILSTCIINCFNRNYYTWSCQSKERLNKNMHMHYTTFIH